LIGGVENGEPRLFGADPTGTPREWKATAIGGSRSELQEILEDGWSEELGLEDGVSLALEALATVVDEVNGEAFSVATIDADEGYRTMTDDEIATRVADLDVEPDEE